MIGLTPDDTPDGHDDGARRPAPEKAPLHGHHQLLPVLDPGPCPARDAEEDHQISKQVAGLDAGQVTTWTSWHRWTAISLLAAAFPAACQRAADGDTAILELILVTVPELLRQLRGTVIP
jgi:hypothetical protein